MAILHTMQLGFHDDRGRHRQIYVSLDAADLRKIKETLERAEKKARTLRSMVEKANIKLFG